MIASLVVVRCGGRRKEYAFDKKSGVVEAIGNQDALALYQLNEEYAPFFCVQCDGSYCSVHWKKQPASGKTSGLCPVGHERNWDQAHFGSCPICGRALEPDVRLYWDTHCPECADKSLDDWSEDSESVEAE